MIPPDYQDEAPCCSNCHHVLHMFTGMIIRCLKYNHVGNIDAVCSSWQRPVDVDITEKGAEP